MRKNNFKLTLRDAVIWRYAAALLFCSVLSGGLHAQKRQLDSLDQLISKERTDTGRINLNIRKIIILGRRNLDTAIYLSQQQLKEAEKANFYDGIFSLHSRLANNFSFKGSFDDARANIQILEKMVKPADSSNIATIYADYGMMYGVQAKYDSSIKYYQRAILINQKLNNIKELTTDYANIAIGYQQLANFPKALEYQQQSLRQAEANHDKELQAMTLLNIGNTYTEIGDTLTAERNFLESLDMAVKNGFRIIELYVYTNLSSLYLGGKKWSVGYDYAIKAATLAKETGDKGIQGASFSKAASALANQNRFAEATLLNKRAIVLADSSKQPLNIAQTYESFGSTFFLQKKYKEAIPYYEKGFKALQGDFIYDVGTVESYQDLSACYEKTGDYIKALANYKTAANIADSIGRKDNVRKSTELRMNYEFAKKQEVLAEEKKRDDEVAKTKQKALIIGLLLVFVLAGVSFNGFRNKQKANTLLTSQKQQIEGTLSELRATQSQLIQSEKMASLGELTAGIAHEIQNPLNFINNFSEVNTELIREMKEEFKAGNQKDGFTIADNIAENEHKINTHGRRADAIVKGMLQHSRSNTGIKELTDINALANEYLRLSYLGLRAKEQDFTSEIKTNFDNAITPINIIPQDIGRMLLNLYNNAFYAVNEKKKTAGADYGPAVSVSTKKTGNQVVITVSDNGNGIPQKIIDKIFQPFFTTKPTGQGTGLGLSLSYDIIKAHGGEIKVQTEAGTGTEFIITLNA
jgi:two-component system, NtrC family, sensor kinase